jgi:uncharacterized protein (UPF0248 family)
LLEGSVGAIRSAGPSSRQVPAHHRGGAGRRLPAIHKDEILHLARHQEDLEKAEHPLHRIMDIEAQDDAVVVRTTDIHLPRRIGEALHHAYHGELHFHYGEEAYFIQVTWRREN